MANVKGTENRGSGVGSNGLNSPMSWAVHSIVNAVVGVTFLLLTLTHAASAPLGHLGCTLMMGAGAIFALTTFVANPSRFLSRACALGSTILMFGFFAIFFRMASGFGEGWYRGAFGIEAVSILIAAFALIPVLAAHSCRLKADCSQRLQRQESVGFFSVPVEVRK